MQLFRRKHASLESCSCNVLTVFQEDGKSLKGHESVCTWPWVDDSSSVSNYFCLSFNREILTRDCVALQLTDAPKEKQQWHEQ